MSDPAEVAVDKAQEEMEKIHGKYATLDYPDDFAKISVKNVLKPIQEWYNDPNMAHDAHMWKRLKDLIFPDGDPTKGSES